MIRSSLSIGLIYAFLHETLNPYGVRRRRTRLLRDQLWRADAGSWQIADRYYTASSAARVVAVFDFRVRFAAEL